MIVLFASNMNGGILQLETKLADELAAIGEIVHCYLPEGAIASIPDNPSFTVHRFQKVKTIGFKDRATRQLVSEINSYKQALVWFVESSAYSFRIMRMLNNDKTTIAVFHDGIRWHPSRYKSIYAFLSKIYYLFLQKKALVSSSYIVLFSNLIRDEMVEHYPKIKQKVSVLPLGAHIPDVNPLRPSEVVDGKRFLLFFGRIDEYKGIGTFLKAFDKCESGKIKFYIAGKGVLSDEEKILISNNDDVTLINRYISDEEMVWLFLNSNGVVLPYIEASQSGIIPIAYFFGKPVVVSNVPGLTQFVIENKTGFICENDDDYICAIKQLCTDSTISWMKPYVTKYYNDYLNWNNNLLALLNKVKGT